MNRLSRRFSAMNPPTYEEARRSAGYAPECRDTLTQALHEAIDRFVAQAGRDSAICVLKMRLKDMGEDSIKLNQIAPLIDQRGQTRLF